MLIDHPARQGESSSLLDWLRYHIGTWMQSRGADLEHQALYPDHQRCRECGAWIGPGFTCDHIPF